MTRRLLIVGVFDPVHVGAHFRGAAQARGWQVDVCDSTEAYAGSAWRRRVNWWLRGRRPAHLRAFSERVVETARRTQPDVVLTTGLAPLDARALGELAARGIPRVNFLTDDPWTSGVRAGWFIDTLAGYDRVFTPRHANIGDLTAAGAAAFYLPFAYAPEVHFAEAASDRGALEPEADVVFAGGGDRDRIAVMSTLIAAGIRVALFGGYWDRDPVTRPHARGFLDAAGLRRAIGAAPIALCLVRRSNRDGHCMRSFEVPAMRGCVLAERTADHERLFGHDGESALFFDSDDELVAQVRRLQSNGQLRNRLRQRAWERITAPGNTYADRFEAMLAHLPVMAHG